MTWWQWLGFWLAFWFIISAAVGIVVDKFMHAGSGDNQR